MGDEQLRRMREARLRRLAEQSRGSAMPRPRSASHAQSAPSRSRRTPAQPSKPRPASRPSATRPRGSGAPANRTPRFGTGEPSRLGHAAALSALLWTVLLATGWALPLELADEVRLSWPGPTKLAVRAETAPWFPDLVQYVLFSGPAAEKQWLYPAVAVAAAFVLRWSRSLPATLHALLGWSAALYGFAALTALGPWALRMWPVTAVIAGVSLLLLFRRPG
ncbi:MULTISPECIES: hypothetical protein [unclassified Streptomyces]|uniref:hypothetical protein n=1 Tax=unclassified Streptomyces TaxID=2593676 RepID=UPI00131A5151|nr:MULTISPECIES: hypothetical protein [unclassified Streptomyces]